MFEAQEVLRNHRCSDPLCDTHLWRARHELDMAKLRIKQLERSLDRHGISRPKIKYVLPLLNYLNYSIRIIEKSFLADWRQRPI